MGLTGGVPIGIQKNYLQGTLSTSTDEKDGSMRIDMFTKMLVPAIAVFLAIIILKPALREGLFVDPK